MLLKQKSKFKVLFIIAFVITTIAASIYLGQAYLHFKNLETSFPLGSMLVSVLGSYYIFLFFVPIVNYLKNRFDIISNWKFIFPHFVFAAILAFAHIALASIFNHLYIANELPLTERIRYGLQNDFLLIFIGYCGLLTTAYFIDYYFKFKDKESEVLELKISKAEPIKHLIIKDKGKLSKVHLEQIKYFEAFDNYLKVHTSNRMYLIRKTLKNIESKLKDLGFVRIHRSYIVNTSYVESAKKLKTGDIDIQLNSGESLKMSRSYKQNIDLITN